jgi:hypothetical protein
MKMLVEMGSKHCITKKRVSVTMERLVKIRKQLQTRKERNFTKLKRGKQRRNIMLIKQGRSMT